MTTLQEQLAASKCHVVVVSFSPKDAVRVYKKDVASEYEYYWDPDRSVYAHFGMGNTLTKVRK